MTRVVSRSVGVMRPERGAESRAPVLHLETAGGSLAWIFQCDDSRRSDGFERQGSRSPEIASDQQLSAPQPPVVVRRSCVSISDNDPPLHLSARERHYPRVLLFPLRHDEPYPPVARTERSPWASSRLSGTALPVAGASFGEWVPRVP